ncbi:hypothetical protein APHWI1_0021 [Anaplasma phagocytophilum str. ApWI1]|uniref:Uncharacterized protein n=3 Tax=Anaplasma phagocytophilum TaxID=948 RepID=Q2GKF9_ANAPZ|nr:hypothetical protein APH_0550 [Anaplasma phagocytophilum str. HZ]KJV60456.1 hypothetical protein APHWEB_1489 [Anaplasma phagocytophilum str. Webster]KJV65778.1 hypothetical protein EPHNCH_0833 [Anaplasma phagocytophilum str. NCH-1]KJV83098.1 hypothetical protein APHHGE2_0821 [Anaplasma phagocytophilum str. HGE2]KJV84849.1 hypothetical protein APHWI1_0021 [Anaplasma phagocytophilum str. ApWI1]KJV87778.1 hypothetical protein APHNYW_0553 [Anaplasma phagocytophilum str. ApNYW]KJV98898.1 hypoth
MLDGPMATEEESKLNLIVSFCYTKRSKMLWKEAVRSW